jgi:hypothetical protein
MSKKRKILAFTKDREHPLGTRVRIGGVDFIYCLKIDPRSKKDMKGGK